MKVYNIPAVINAGKLSETLNNERESKIRLNLSFVRLVTGVRLTEAANYFRIWQAKDFYWLSKNLPLLMPGLIEFLGPQLYLFSK